MVWIGGPRPGIIGMEPPWAYTEARLPALYVVSAPQDFEPLALPLGQAIFDRHRRNVELFQWSEGVADQTGRHGETYGVPTVILVTEAMLRLLGAAYDRLLEAKSVLPIWYGVAPTAGPDAQGTVWRDSAPDLQAPELSWRTVSVGGEISATELLWHEPDGSIALADAVAKGLGWVSTAFATIVAPDGRPISKDLDAITNLDLNVQEFNDRMLEHLYRHPDLMYQLSPRRFEELVAELWSRNGYEVELTPASGDDGADVYAVRHDHSGSALVVVQAKRYKPELKVKAAAVRELFGTVNLLNASAGVLVTTSTFQPAAERYAAQLRYRLTLRDYGYLQQMLHKP